MEIKLGNVWNEAKLTFESRLVDLEHRLRCEKEDREKALKAEREDREKALKAEREDREKTLNAAMNALKREREKRKRALKEQGEHKNELDQKVKELLKALICVVLKDVSHYPILWYIVLSISLLGSTESFPSANSTGPCST